MSHGKGGRVLARLGKGLRAHGGNRLHRAVITVAEKVVCGVRLLRGLRLRVAFALAVVVPVALVERLLRRDSRVVDGFAANDVGVGVVPYIVEGGVNHAAGSLGVEVPLVICVASHACDGVGRAAL